MAACIEARKLYSDAVLVNLGARFQNVGYGLSCFNIILLTVFRGLADPHFGVGDHVLALVDLYTERLSDDRCLNDLNSAVADIDLKLLAINSEGVGYNYRLSNQIRADQDFLLGNGDARQANGGLGLLDTKMETTTVMALFTMTTSSLVLLISCSNNLKTIEMAEISVRLTMMIGAFAEMDFARLVS